MTKHTKVVPATPLPWDIGQVNQGRFPAYPIFSDKAVVTEVAIRARGGSCQDALYIAHACNSYLKLVEALRYILAHPGDSAQTKRGEALLRELGETE